LGPIASQETRKQSDESQQKLGIVVRAVRTKNFRITHNFSRLSAGYFFFIQRLGDICFKIACQPAEAFATGSRRGGEESEEEEGRKRKENPGDRLLNNRKESVINLVNREK